MKKPMIKPLIDNAEAKIAGACIRFAFGLSIPKRGRMDKANMEIRVISTIVYKAMKPKKDNVANSFSLNLKKDNKPDFISILKVALIIGSSRRKKRNSITPQAKRLIYRGAFLFRRIPNSPPVNKPGIA